MNNSHRSHHRPLSVLLAALIAVVACAAVADRALGDGDAGSTPELAIATSITAYGRRDRATRGVNRAAVGATGRSWETVWLPLDK